MFIPNYFHKFKCVAEKCRHNCCIGWEIDIDSNTLDYYNSLDTDFGKTIRDSISYDSCAHFVLRDNERCPHLNGDGLCNIICKLGEGGICDICTEHPRFYNCFDTFTEAGLGLCCEEAARIIIGEEEKFSVTSDNGEDIDFSEEEAVFLRERQQLFSILCDRSISIKSRFALICEKYGFNFESINYYAMVSLYKSLERLDEAWTEILDSLDNCCFDGAILENSSYSLYFENLACYFIYRHLADGLYEGNIPQIVMFALSACLLLGFIFQVQPAEQGKLSAEDIADLSRMFSSEVEYSEDNIEFILNNISGAFTV